MAVLVPLIRCSLTWEQYNGSNEIIKKDVYKLVDFGLSRNEFREILFEVTVIGRETKKRFITVKYESLHIFRKFAKEGKITLDLEDSHTKLLLSNAPPSELAVFTKTLAAKLAGSKDVPTMSTRKKLLFDVASFTEGISPVTTKDISNMRVAEAGGRGLLKMRGYTPTVSSPLNLKRKREDEKENSCASPILSGIKLNNTELNQSSPKRRANILARSTPTRQTGLLARRPLRADPAQVPTQEQRYVLECVKAGKNVFITGGAGTGKSFLIQKIIGTLPPDQTFVTASTGVAAYQIGGRTLHNFAGIGAGNAEIAVCVNLAQRKAVSAQWRKCKHLIIDEVSMVDGNYFKKLEHVARKVKKNEKPFGGIQLILCGDFFQLPPVVKAEDRRFAFETSSWLRCGLTNIELTIVKRQSDQSLVDILSRLRKGKCSEEDAEILKKTSSNQFSKNGIVPTKLCTHTDDVSIINQRELGKCEGEIKRFVAADSDPNLAKFLDQHTAVDSSITLKLGAQVMLLKNLNVCGGLVNGARGRVEKFSSGGNPVVRFLDGAIVEIKREKWSVKGGPGVTLSRSQIPLKLAWAFSIHKSQGMTLDCVEVSLSRVFECGQAYVALSRAKSINSLRILDFKANCVRADSKVLKFYKNITFSKPSFQQKIYEMV